MILLSIRNIVALELFSVCVQVMRPNPGADYVVHERNPTEWTFDTCPKVKLASHLRAWFNYVCMVIV